MKNQFFKLAISTTDGQFIARYSAKGLAELNFPKVGSARCAVGRRRRGNETQIFLASSKSARDSSRRLLQIPAQILRWHRATAAGLKSSLAGRKPKKSAAARSGRNGISKKCLECTAENFHWPDEKLRRNCAGDWQTQGCSRGGRRVRRESGSGFGSVPSRAGREQKTRRLFRRVGLETQIAGAGRN